LLYIEDVRLASSQIHLGDLLGLPGEENEMV